MNDKHFALSKKNFVWLGTGIVLILLGFILMLGAPSTKDAYNPDIFSFRRIVLAPSISFIGFVLIMIGILVNPARKKTPESED
ncbi:MAG: DUF3098 domain-containing protein [Bacteroidales bacterium]|nr:DUF3098 domain-containing protein [Bacteroidales bacterium]